MHDARPACYDISTDAARNDFASIGIGSKARPAANGGQYVTAIATRQSKRSRAAVINQ